ncbi:hypothetical protein NEMIN01_1838 [Nematocida minor]|uniref:uncharacterized protein n=1 Tax=Nematocida minor TaxID=1912983 RepID=UPI00221F0676|nr:uncharacterized protein NEMIN01_1838 [Nematocida minor]KAI5192145.1 hypothetical protein NEMIN01_1838 [Nematocida minor]
MKNITMAYSHLLFVDAINSWGPVDDIVDEGLTDKEIEVMATCIAETLSEKKMLSMHDKLVLELEEFLFDVLEEYGVSVTDDLLADLVKKIVSTHNKAIK